MIVIQLLYIKYAEPACEFVVNKLIVVSIIFPNKD